MLECVHIYRTYVVPADFPSNLFHPMRLGCLPVLPVPPHKSKSTCDRRSIQVLRNLGREEENNLQHVETFQAYVSHMLGICRYYPASRQPPSVVHSGRDIVVPWLTAKHRIGADEIDTKPSPEGSVVLSDRASQDRELGNLHDMNMFTIC